MDDKKSMDDIIMERIFDIGDGSYTIKTSGGNLVVEKRTFDNSNNVFFDKQVSVNIYKNGNKFFSTYYKKEKKYLDVGKYGFSRNENRKFVVDYPECESSKTSKGEVYNYQGKNDVVQLKFDSKDIFIRNDSVIIYNHDFSEKHYSVKDDKIYDDLFRSTYIIMSTGDIFIKINGNNVKFEKDENVEKKLKMYYDKIEKLKNYVRNNMKDIKDIININFDIKFYDDYLKIQEVVNNVAELKDIRELYIEGSKILNYKHDEKIKREIAVGLNEFCKKRIGYEEEIVYVKSTPEGKMISKLINLNNGYYTTLTSKGLIEIDVNLYKDITIAFNNSLVFKIEYGEIQYISKILRDIIIEINNKIDKELSKQDKINKHNEEIEKQNEIKRLEKKLKELKKD